MSDRALQASRREGGVARGMLFLVLTGVVLGGAYNWLGLEARRPWGLPWIAQDRVDALPTVAAQAPSAGSGHPSAGSGQAPSAGSGQAPSAGSGQAPSAGSGQGGGRYTTDSSDPLAIPAPAAAGLPEIPAIGRPVVIELTALKLYIDAAAAVVIDAREHEEYVAGHIQGAVSLPYETAVSDPTLIEGLVTGGRPLITYCGGGSCEMSLSLAEELLFAGHERVAVYMAGYPEWVGAGYPVTRGEAP